MGFILNHPALLALALPFIIGAIPALLVKAEKAALAKLFSVGDSTDQKAVRATVKVWVVWAEEKYDIDGTGPKKLAAVSAIVGRALPFIPSDQRDKLIEEAVKELDTAANDAIAAPLPAAAPSAPPQP